MDEKKGQELMNLEYLNKDEMKRLQGDSVHELRKPDFDGPNDQVDTVYPVKQIELDFQEEEHLQGSCFCLLSSEACYFNRQQLQICMGSADSAADCLLMLYDHLLVFSGKISFAFSQPTQEAWLIFEVCVEVAFGLDILLRFFHEYRDSETHEVIHDVKKIAWKYLV
jgi:hypothetical protein